MRRVLLTLAISGCAWTLHAQPAFEVASIKPNSGGSLSRLIRPSPGGLSVSNMTVRDLLTFAYQVRDFQVSGGPGWIDAEHYDIEAKSKDKAGNEQIRAMLQALLADRFKLVLHRETRDLPIYALTVAKGGLKIQPTKEGACVDAPNGPPAPGKARSCGFAGSGRGELMAAKADMTQIAGLFSLVLGRVVADRTGIAGRFPMDLKYAPDNAPADTGLPSIFTAAQEQLGLKLESTRGAVEVLVIDQAEKPAPD